MNSSVTRIFEDVSAGKPGAMDELLALVYDELRSMAVSKLAREKPGQTLQPTALVHEVYLRILGSESAPHWRNRQGFFKAAADAMRRVLVDNARRKLSVKRGSGAAKVELDDALLQIESPVQDILDLNEALAELEKDDAEACDVVKLHYFAGLSMAEIAEVLGLHVRMVQRTWEFARTFLYHKLNPSRR